MAKYSGLCDCGHSKADHSRENDVCAKCWCYTFTVPGEVESEKRDSSICTCGHDSDMHRETVASACEHCFCKAFRSAGIVEDFPARGEVRTKSATGGEKGVKPERFDLIPVEALQEVARVYGFGAEKYDAHNWRKGYEWSKSYAAMMRHANQFWQGEDVDEETGCSHLASVIFHAMALMVFVDEQPQYDDRFKPELTQVQKENLKAFTDEVSFVENVGAEAIRRFQETAERVRKFGIPPKRVD